MAFTKITAAGIGSTGTVTLENFVVTGNINSSGVSTLGNTIVGGGTTQLIVTGNARITGILTIGTSSITLDGSSNQVNVGTGVTLHHTNGVQVGGNNVHSTGLLVNQINASGVVTATGGFNIGIQSGGAVITTGVVTAFNFVGLGNTFLYNTATKTVDISISGSALSISTSTTSVAQDLAFVGGSGTSVIGIATTTNRLVYIPSSGNLGIGTTNPTSKLHVIGNSIITGVSTFGSSNGIGTVTIGIGTTALLVQGNARITGVLSIGQGTITLDGNTGILSATSGLGFGGDPQGERVLTFHSKSGDVGYGGSNVGSGVFRVSGPAQNLNWPGLAVGLIDGPAVSGTYGLVGGNDSTIIGGNITATQRSSLGIATASSLNVSGVTTFNNNVILGDSSTDIVNYISRVGSGITPSQDDTHELGSSSLRWKKIFVGEIVGSLTGAASSISVTDDTTNENRFLVLSNTTNGISTVLTDSGIFYNPSTNSLGVVGIITSQNLNVSGISTFAGITTVTGETLFSKQLNVSGVVTASSFSGSASGLTGIPAGQLTGSLPAINGSALTGITAGATLSAASGSQRVVLTGQTSETMTAAATNSTLTFNSSTNTLSSSIFSGSFSAAADQAIVNQHDGNSSQWYGRILSKNSTANKASFLGTHGSIAGVFAHNNALNAWADLYVNTVNGTDGGAVILSNSTFASNGDATIKRLVIGGNYSNNPYNSVSSTRLMFGGGDANAQDNYFIGTNLENTGGNYTKLDLRWHTGIRMGAQPAYGGIRMYDSEALGSLLFQVNGGSNYLYKYQWLWTNGGTGMYSDTNGAHIYPNNASYGSWRIDGSRNGWSGIEAGGSAVSLMMNTDTYGFHYNGVGWRLYNQGGSIYCPGNIVAYWSDVRLKENIEILSFGTGIEIINKLKPSKFNWKESAKEYNDTIEAGKEEIGLIAQEVQEVIPDAVIQNKAGVPAHGRGEAYYTINYNKITPYLVQAIKDLNEKINQLETEIKKLKEN